MNSPFVENMIKLAKLNLENLELIKNLENETYPGEYSYKLIPKLRQNSEKITALLEAIAKNERVE